MICNSISLESIVKPGAVCDSFALGNNPTRPVSLYIEDCLKSDCSKKWRPDGSDRDSDEYRWYFNLGNPYNFLFYYPKAKSFVSNVSPESTAKWVNKFSASYLFFSNSVIEATVDHVKKIEILKHDDEGGLDPVAVAKAFGGKALTGTAKQKEWANKIRADKLKQMAFTSAEFVAKHPAAKSARFWIDNRNKRGDLIALELYQKDRGQ
jgi:hypothetical protein